VGAGNLHNANVSWNRQRGVYSNDHGLSSVRMVAAPPAQGRRSNALSAKQAMAALVEMGAKKHEEQTYPKM
jgi:hypothetical protein